MKRIKYILIFLIIFLCSKQIKLEYREIKIERKQQEIIKNIEKKEEIPNQYEGIIIIEKYGIKRLIKKSTDKEILDLGYVGIYKNSKLDFDQHIILAGHNKKDIFSYLHNIEIGDDIIIKTNKEEYLYKVEEKVIINDKDFSYFNEKNNILTLITCTNDPHKRLLVISHKIG